MALMPSPFLKWVLGLLPSTVKLCELQVNVSAGVRESDKVEVQALVYIVHLALLPDVVAAWTQQGLQR